MIAPDLESAIDRLQELVEEARVIRNVLHGLHSRYDRQAVEQAAPPVQVRLIVMADVPGLCR